MNYKFVSLLLISFSVFVSLGFLDDEEESTTLRKIYHFGWSEELGRDIAFFEELEIPESIATSEQLLLDYLFKDYRLKDEFGEVHIDIEGVFNTTAFVKFSGDSDLITNRSGTNGATDIWANIVFNLTEYDYIDSVYFLVDEGAHFTSGESERLDLWAIIPDKDKSKYSKLLESKVGKEGYYWVIEELAKYGRKWAIGSLKEFKAKIDRGERKSNQEIKSELDSAINTILKRHK